MKYLLKAPKKEPRLSLHKFCIITKSSSNTFLNNINQDKAIHLFIEIPYISVFIWQWQYAF